MFRLQIINILILTICALQSVTSPVSAWSFDSFSNFSLDYFVAFLCIIDLFFTPPVLCLMEYMFWLEIDEKQSEYKTDGIYFIKLISVCPVGKCSSHLIYLRKILLVFFVGKAVKNMF